jgi:exonuclease SbcC
MSQATPSKPGRKKPPSPLERYVDDLENEQDYWLTITDAARVARRQDITIRRWIAAGDLPVRRKRLGLNQRTRQVRASDLARLTPIVDPLAAITGEPGRVDLMSIPEQQAAILTEHQHLLEAHAQLTEQAEAAKAQVAEGIEQGQKALAGHARQVAEALEAQQAKYISLLTQQGERLSAQREELLAAITTASQAAEAQASQVSLQVTAEAEARQQLEQRFTTLEQTVATLQQQTEHHTEQQQHFAERLEALEQQIEQRHQEVQGWLTQFESVTDQALAHLGEELEAVQATLTAQLETARRELEQPQAMLQRELATLQRERWQELERLAQLVGYEVKLEEGLIDLLPITVSPERVTLRAGAFRYDLEGLGQAIVWLNTSGGGIAQPPGTNE